MKKLLFVLVFTFIGGSAFSQMYTLTVSNLNINHPSNCAPDANTSDNNNRVLTKIDPTGNVTYVCIPEANSYEDNSQWVVVHQEINDILTLGYKVIGTPCDFFKQSNYVSINECTWYFAVP